MEHGNSFSCITLSYIQLKPVYCRRDLSIQRRMDRREEREVRELHPVTLVGGAIPW